MAKYDHGGGCACGLSKVCDCGYRDDPYNKCACAISRVCDGSCKCGYVKNESVNVVSSSKEMKAMDKPETLVKRVKWPMVDIVDKDTLHISMVTNGLTVSRNVKIPYDLATTISDIQNLAEAIEGVGSDERGYGDTWPKCF
jgi:hypothetical protein